MRPDEHAGLRQEIGIHILGRDNGQDLAIDNVQHLLPNIFRDRLQTKMVRGAQILWRGSKPDLQELLGAYTPSQLFVYLSTHAKINKHTLEGIGGVKILGCLMIDCQRRSRSERRRRLRIVLRDKVDHLFSGRCPLFFSFFLSNLSNRRVVLYCNWRCARFGL